MVAAIATNLSSVLLVTCDLPKDASDLIVDWAGAEGLAHSMPPAEFMARLHSLPDVMWDVYHDEVGGPNISIPDQVILCTFTVPFLISEMLRPTVVTQTCHARTHCSPLTGRTLCVAGAAEASSISAAHADAQPAAGWCLSCRTG